MHRRHLALVAVLALVALGGCSAITGPDPVDQEQLNQSATYDWDTDADVTVLVNRSSYQAIYAVDSNATLEVYDRDGLGRERSVPISALRFRFENGTVVGPSNSSLGANRTRQRTTIRLPGDGNVSGQIAYSAPRNGKTFATPTHLDGATYAVTLPPGARVGIPLLSQVSPGGYETDVDEATDRMTVRWPEGIDSRGLQVRYYLERDLLIFGGLAAVAVVVGTVGTLYYYRQLQAVKRRRKEAGVDLEEEDYDDDFGDDGPPPGMR
ncbi:DUF5803 family protein [Haloarcula litorea]|uniref:DUF5803 family protein n=1 Tax=Haloarcula litorea TaxID=3032579 RepID=UPI0023E7C405|nr:DUF5803 family protein [Halomicroarcula sp. GDY20]